MKTMGFLVATLAIHVYAMALPRYFRENIHQISRITPEHVTIYSYHQWPGLHHTTTLAERLVPTSTPTAQPTVEGLASGQGIDPSAELLPSAVTAAGSSDVMQMVTMTPTTTQPQASNMIVLETQSWRWPSSGGHGPRISRKITTLTSTSAASTATPTATAAARVSAVATPTSTVDPPSGSVAYLDDEIGEWEAWWSEFFALRPSRTRGPWSASTTRDLMASLTMDPWNDKPIWKRKIPDWVTNGRFQVPYPNMGEPLAKIESKPHLSHAENATGAMSISRLNGKHQSPATTKLTDHSIVRRYPKKDPSFGENIVTWLVNALSSFCGWLMDKIERIPLNKKLLWAKPQD